MVNRAPRSPSARAEVTAAIAALVEAAAVGLPSPVFLPEKRVDELLRDGRRLPTALTEPLAGAFAAVVGSRSPAVPADESGGRLVRPGSLGSWAEPEDEAPDGAAFG